MIETFAALAEPNRYRIIETLRRGPKSVNELTERLGLNQPLVSKHLRILRDAGLVRVTPQAQLRLYSLDAASFQRLHAWLERYRQLWDERLDQLDALVQELNDEKENE